ncbi:Six-hairpin glycosidase-like protein [Gymnopilus junonius]|uniref:Trehalase n=1 Tax=Gymnopilus junonius TaxID=109634 RepID=A0A9P5NDF2_GYMJU|nr:Six-hairpin glycosidase-like protein [Gymnopilus junonius]
MLTAAATLTALLFHGAAAQSSATAPVALSTEVPSITESTAIASATAASSSQLPSQAPIPPKQAWCPSEIFCAGPLLQTIGVANLFPDDKTFVDKPTSKSSQAILADFQNISQPTYGAIVKFVDSDFTGEGLELEAIPLPNFNPNPPFLNNVTATLPKAFAQTVHGFWTQLIRSTNSSTLCGSSGKCESTLIPLNHTFVVPGGRFREQYYWDSFWIVEGLIQSQLFSVANDTLQNFMDELEIFGFIPNGGRIYYLNRSQPPLFIQMLAKYIDASGDKGILTRALPLAEKELAWWSANRSIQVTSPFTNKTFTMFRYAVNNTAPRPESYLADYTTVNSVSPALNDSAKAELYAELASGAESGWDYTTRFFLSPNDGLNSVNVRNTIGIDLNSILYKNHVLMASFYGTANTTSASRHTAAAESLKAAILDLFWDSSKQEQFFSVATFYPYWSGIIPDEHFSAFSSVNLVLNRDAPNAWPPHQYIVLNALRALPSNITSGAIPYPTFKSVHLRFDPLWATRTCRKGASWPTCSRRSDDINATTSGPEGWGQALQRQLANRVFTSILAAGEQATGGSIPNILPRLPDAELNVTRAPLIMATRRILIDCTAGQMFEKFSNLDVNSAGQGAGFGWTNGVLLWVASNYGSVIDSPICPDLLITPTGTTKSAHPNHFSHFTVILATLLTRL